MKNKKNIIYKILQEVRYFFKITWSYITNPCNKAEKLKMVSSVERHKIKATLDKEPKDIFDEANRKYIKAMAERKGDKRNG